MGRRASLIATLTEEPDEASLEALPAEVDGIEVRADLVGDVPASWLRQHFAGRLVYTLRSRAEGGGFEGSRARRRERLTAAAADFDLVDLEADRDLQPAVLDAIAPEKRLLSWHGPGCEMARLEAIFERMSQIEAVLYKLVSFPREAVEETAPLQLLLGLRRDDVIAFAGGEAGLWTRFLAPYAGAPFMYGAWGSQAGAPGQPSVARICRDYPHPDLPQVERLFGIVGRPVSHSLSPRLHNGAYRALGISALYLPFGPDSFADFWLEVVEGGVFPALGFSLEGLSVTAPYKASAAAVAGALSPLAQVIDSANTLTLRDGVWEGESTDPRGVVGALEEAGVFIAGNAAVIGCGGAGRAAAAGLARAGARVVLVNRSEEKGAAIAEALGMPFRRLEGFDPAGCSIVVNATSLGSAPEDPLPFDLDRVDRDATVVDMVYSERPTALVEEFRSRGGRAVDGRSVLLHQAVDQFRLMTGTPLPVSLGRELLGLDEEG
ncbi:MAG: type I 3-dehydroquinate dehydratase, partial [Thermoanaerobaculia bacterium]|nr:type I 3-dehydroquinate dehydratase [Thermoanaerobaculia bacterium]